jgi:hypothetical protein
VQRRVKVLVEKMGLIKEPKNVDFYVIDKLWTAEEQKEFSAFIKMRKEQRKKRTLKNRSASSRQKLSPTG